MPQLVWRPKKGFQAHPDATLEKILPSSNQSLDSRAGAAESSASLNKEQDQQNLPSHTNPNWEHEQHDAAANLGFFGANPHPNPAHPIQLDQQQQEQAGHDGNANMEVDAEDDEMKVDAEPKGGEPWAQWNPAIFAGDIVQGNQIQANQMQGNQVPQHPAVPQHILDLDLSGSSMRFLHVDGLKITIDEIIQLDQSDDSSSSNDASSVPNEERARFLAARSHCAITSPFHRKCLPGSSQAGPSTILMQPILIDRNVMEEQNTESQIPAPTGLEIVPWRPVLDVIALQLLPQVVEARQKIALSAPPPTLILGEDGVISGTQSKDGITNITQPGPRNFEFQTQQIRPSPPRTRGQNAIGASKKRKNMSLPNVVSNSDAHTPLVQKSVRRSSRFSASNNGYCPVVRIEREPSKKHKNLLVQIDEATGKAGPVSIEVLQGWGVKCGVDPSDLTDDALMQAPSPQVPDVEASE